MFQDQIWNLRREEVEGSKGACLTLVEQLPKAKKNMLRKNFWTIFF
jgi:hypothetical protein